MKRSIILFLSLVSCVTAFGQSYKIFRKDGNSVKIQAAEVDSIVQDGKHSVLTLYMRNGNSTAYDQAEVDSVVCYDPAISLTGVLKARGNYNYFLRLLQDVGPEWLNDHLEGAGAASLFVADDRGWERFFADNAQRPAVDMWHTATSYETLTEEQKHVLLSGAIAAADNLPDILGKRLSSEHLYKPMLTTRVHAGDIPYTYSPEDKDYWARFRNGDAGILLSSVAGKSSILSFTPETMKTWGITPDDLQTILPGATDNMAGDVSVTESGTPTFNGMLNTIYSPLVYKGSMADVIRTNGQTNIFSHILDRYSAPYYSETATAEFRKAHPDARDSVFVKRYFSASSEGLEKLDYTPDGTNVWFCLKFDPGWTGGDAAMFVPSDEALWDFFTDKAGQSLIRRCYAKEGTEEAIPYTRPTTQEELFRQIDCIHVSELLAYINPIMMRSFKEAVPSKMTMLLDDAQEQLFYPEDVDKIKNCILADNGAVYIMDKVYGPVDYTSVTAPIFLSNTSNVMRWAIYNGAGAAADYIGKSYYAYLKALGQDITVFIPNDAAMQYYYDPISFESTTKRLIQFSYDGKNFPIRSVNYCYVPATGEIGSKYTGSGASLQQVEVCNFLSFIIESNTIFHNGTNSIRGKNEYFQTWNGNVVKVIRDGNGQIVGAQGTMQIENERNGMNTGNPGSTLCKVTASSSGLSNGQTFTLDAPLIPTYRSLYNTLTAGYGKYYGWVGEYEEAWQNNPFRVFFSLCETNTSLIRRCGLVDENLSGEQQVSAMKKYRIFSDTNGLDYNFAPLTGSTPFTAYIPTNEVLEAAIARGDIPTWEEIGKDYESHSTEDGGLQSAADSLRIQNKIKKLTNIVMSHFYFGLAIADQESQSLTQKSITAQPGAINVQIGDGQLSLTDPKTNNTYRVTETKNLFFCDYTCSRMPVGTPMSTSSKRTTIETQRPGVIHQIDGVMGLDK